MKSFLTFVNSIPYVEIKISWGVYIQPFKPCMYNPLNSKYEGLRHDSIFMKKRLKSRIKLSRNKSTN